MRAEVARLVPELASGEPEEVNQAGNRQRERLFPAVADMLTEVAA